MANTMIGTNKPADRPTGDDAAAEDATSTRSGQHPEPVADQATRVDDLRSDLEQADERSEGARKAYLAGVEGGATGDELRQLRREWDNARAARNAVESLVMVQDPEAISTND